MGFICSLLSITFVVLLVLAVGRTNKSAAYRLLEGSFRLFEPEPETETTPTKTKGTRQQSKYISPFMKKRVAADQRWRCKVCGHTLLATYEIDHVLPTFRGGGNEKYNLQALCKTCHISKSAMESTSRGR